MNLDQLKSIISQNSKPELAKLPGMVHQVWEDGEITCQKCGELLWQRSLHMFTPGEVRLKVDAALFPERMGEHGFIFATDEGALEVREALEALAKSVVGV